MPLLYGIVKSFSGLFYPKLCEACGNLLVDNEHTLCTTCCYNIPKTNYWNDDNNPVAQSFWGKVKIEKACSYFFFNKGSNYRNLLHKLKYKGQKEIGITLGYYFAQELNNANWLNDIDLLTPVPLHPIKQRKRGYNQSECIIQGISKAVNKPIVYNNLIKTANTKSQTQKSRFERSENVSGVFKTLNPCEFENKHILLIDDTITTGATLEACAQTLLQTCYCKISVAALAYVPL